MPIAAYPPLGWGRTELLRVPQEMARVDALLDDPVFFAPFAPHFHPLLGRPSTPVECYLRLMFLKFRYRLAMRAHANLRVRQQLDVPGPNHLLPLAALRGGVL